MTLKIEIEMSNAAFEEDRGAEAGRILKRLIDTLAGWPGENAFCVGLLDINGNKVGKAQVKP